MKFILWLLFGILIIYMGYEAFVIEQRTPAYSLVKMEFAGSISGKQMLRTWQQKTYGGQPLLAVARSNTRLDYLFILVYAALLVMYSYLRMQREHRYRLNVLLRLNLLLALVAGAADMIENGLILYNIRHVADEGLYLCAFIPSTIKWALLAWCLLVYLISRLSTTRSGV